MSTLLSEKERRWQELNTTYGSGVVDALGKKIDPGILLLVVALNALGITTTASCEGHLEGSFAPYVDIVCAPPDDERQEALEALTFAQRLEMTDGEEAALPYLRAAQERLHALDQHYHLPVRRCIISWLNTFYSARVGTRYECQLALRSLITFGVVEQLRLENAGAELLAEEEAAVHAQKLATYQAEMAAFALFLKEVYWQS